MKVKYCSKCDKKKKLNQFYVSRTIKSGYSAYCKPCERQHTKEYQASKRGRKMLKRHSKKNYQKFKHKYSARVEVREAVSRGELTKPTNCERCDSSKKLQAHHEDYSKPLDVDWLCILCHRFIHGRLTDIKLLEKVGSNE